ncbi:MAG: CAP domain-containing protein [Candidatus Odyssella sp.]|nr:CAP domain-containing protein [Candidatus Odyssella sp.]
MRSTTNHLFFALLLLGALGARAAPGTAGEADLGPYFERLKTAPPAAVPRAAPQARAEPRALQRASVETGTLDAATLEHTVFNHINLHRLAKGLRPLSHLPGLAATARAHSGAIASGARPMNHDGMRDRLMPHMASFGSRAGGEILAYNRNAGDPAQAAMRSWINSDRHRDVIEGDYATMGVGIARRDDGAWVFTVLFVR